MLEAKDWSLVLVGRDMNKPSVQSKSGALLVEADISTPEGAASAVQACIQERGAPPQALAHCAGSVMLRPPHQTDPAQYRDCLRANLDSAFFMRSPATERFFGDGRMVRQMDAPYAFVEGRIALGSGHSAAPFRWGILGIFRH